VQLHPGSLEVGTAWQPSPSSEARMNNLLRNYT
jgi:hypothetical protein